MKLVIYLNVEGDGFNVLESGTFQSLTTEDAEKIHPVIAQVFSAKGKEEVAKSLHTLKEIVQQDLTTRTSYFFKDGKEVNNFDDYIIKSDNSQNDIKLSILHKHAPYLGHNQIKGSAHRESIEKMIEFVEDSNRVSFEFTSSSCNIL